MNLLSQTGNVLVLLFRNEKPIIKVNYYFQPS